MARLWRFEAIRGPRMKGSPDPGRSELPFGRRQTVQRAGGLPRRSSPGPAGPPTCRRRKIGAHDALPSCRRFCVFWESAGSLKIDPPGDSKWSLWARAANLFHSDFRPFFVFIDTRKRKLSPFILKICALVGQAVQQRRSHALALEDLAPLAEG